MLATPARTDTRVNEFQLKLHFGSIGLSLYQLSGAGRLGMKMEKKNVFANFLSFSDFHSLSLTHTRRYVCIHYWHLYAYVYIQTSTYLYLFIHLPVCISIYSSISLCTYLYLYSYLSNSLKRAREIVSDIKEQYSKKNNFRSGCSIINQQHWKNNVSFSESGSLRHVEDVLEERREEKGKTPMMWLLI